MRLTLPTGHAFSWAQVKFGHSLGKSPLFRREQLGEVSSYLKAACRSVRAACVTHWALCCAGGYGNELLTRHAACKGPRTLFDEPSRPAWVDATTVKP